MNERQLWQMMLRYGDKDFRCGDEALRGGSGCAVFEFLDDLLHGICALKESLLVSFIFVDIG